MVKLLEQHGWKLDRVKGSHHLFRKDGFTQVNVPVHGKKELSYGVEQDVFKKSDLIKYWKNSKGDK